MAIKTRNVAIIGLGTFGISVARELTRMGDEVLGIDSDEKPVIDLNDEIASTLQADATDPKALAECGIESYDSVIISIGENIEASILSAMNALEAGCAEVWVKAQNETQAKILKAIGITHVVLPEQSYGAYVAQIVHNPHVSDYIDLGDEQYLIEMTIKSHNVKHVVGDKKTLSSYDIQCLAIHTKEGLINPDEYEGQLDQDIKMILYGSRFNLRKFADEL